VRGLARPEGSADAERQLIIEFGRRLREARRRAGLSQAEVAARLGIRQGYVSRVELGAENVTLSACVRFAQAVGCVFSNRVYYATKAARQRQRLRRIRAASARGAPAGRAQPRGTRGASRDDAGLRVARRTRRPEYHAVGLRGIRGGCGVHVYDGVNAKAARSHNGFKPSPT
jgi:transcriptional regulator with XRE-family HTH domain